MPSAVRPPFRRPRWGALALVTSLVVLVLALAARALPGARARSLPTAAAQWIWKGIDWDDHQPAVFYVLRDFDLAAPPASARLLVTADEEYVLTLNGRRIGAGAFQPGAVLDVYEAGPFLLPGANRLMVEVRSARGAGGLLASLVDSAGHMLVGTDDRWRLFTGYELGLARGWLPLDRGVPVYCWGYPPMGRWGRPRLGPLKSLLGETAGSPVAAVSAIPQPPVLPAPAGRPPGSPVLYDWGREVTGYVSLELAPMSAASPPAELGEMQKALLFTGDSPPDPLRSSPVTSILIAPGRQAWLDSRPRRFRYALILGLVPPASLTVLPVPETVVPPPAAREERGVLGIVPPPLRTPVEDEVWGKLQRFTGIAGRKEL
ncbi:MAG TPA: hypothetical protein VGQ28_05960 [Thermoanaerobaculia bacterium]|nr:hypothetical protein [Thermoanaerobaculia bacterium]